MPHRFIQKIGRETHNQIQTKERPLLLVPSTENEIIINGLRIKRGPHTCYFIPTYSYCHCVAQVDAIVITLTAVEIQPLLWLVNNMFRYQQLDSIYQPMVGEPIYDLLIDATQGNASGSEYLYDILKTIISQLNINTIGEGNMTNLQRLAFAAEIEKLMTDCPTSTATTIASHFSVTEHTLWRKCKAVFGISTRDFIASWRYQQAIHLLTSTDNSIATITEQVGYANTEYLRNQIKKNTGYPALQFRRKTQQTL